MPVSVRIRLGFVKISRARHHVPFKVTAERASRRLSRPIPGPEMIDMTAHPTRSRLIAVATGLALVLAGLPLALGTSPAAAATPTLYVSPSGSDSAAGTQAAPLRTLARAVSKATSGTTVVLAGGTYRESVQVYGKDVDILGAPGATVVLDGSRTLTGWQAGDGGWYVDGWTHEFARTTGDMIDPNNPMAAYPDQAFLDGAPLAQVATQGALGAGRFYVDNAADRLWIGDDPAGHTIDASYLPFAIYFNKAHGSSLRNVTVRRYATPAANMAAVRAYSNDVTVADSTFEHNAYMGLSAMGNRFTFTNLLVQDNAYIGVHGHLSNDFSLTRSTILRNNTQRFDFRHSAAGVKVTTATGIEFRNNYVADNLGPGLWTDLSGIDVTVVGNLLERNLRSSIFMELSGFVTVVDNVVIGSGVTGIRILETNDAEVWNNALYRSEREIWVQEGPRTDPSANELANWDSNRANVHNNVMAQGRAGSEALFVADDWTNNRSAWDMGTVLDRNAYWMPAGTVARLSKWGRSPSSAALSSTLSQHQSQTGQDANGLWSTAAANPFARDAASYDLRAPEAIGSGRAANARVAAALGIPVGTILPIGPLSALAPSAVAGGPIVNGVVTPPPPTTPPSTSPTTSAPTTSAPTTSAPTTSAPTTSAPTTSAPTTSAPPTSAPTTTAPPVTTTTQPPAQPVLVDGDIRAIDGRHALTAVRTTDGGTASFRAAGSGEVPGDARSVVLSVTATGTSQRGRLIAHACGVKRPSVVGLRYMPSSETTSTFVVDIGREGRVCLYTSVSAVLDVDVTGFVPADSTYRSVRPARLFNSVPGYPTVSGPSTSTGRVAAGSVVRIPVVGVRGVPATAAGVTLAIASSTPLAPGTATVFACGTARPDAISLQVRGAVASANLAIADLGTGGAVCLTTSVDTHLAVGLLGWFPAASDFTAVRPARLVDTRISGATVDGEGRRVGRVAAGSVRRIPIAGRGGIPADATAVTMTVTVVGPRASGDLTVYACDAQRPSVRTLRYVATKSATTAAFARLVDGDLCIYSSGAAHVMVDVTGWID
jgi:hypothetical protein